jgi:leader peptidase (prepilin peptidase)/N-methyltransferase
MQPLLAFELPAFVLGLLFGSFLNVCISRLPEHRSISKPRSHCPDCKQTIAWYDNVPLLSWVVLRGKCRRCGAAISWRYPAVELAMGLWGLAVFSQWSTLEGYKLSRLSGPTTAEYIGVAGFAILGFLLIGLVVMDWQTHKLPDAFTFPGMLIGFLLVCTQAIFLAPGEDDIHLTPHHDLRMSSPGSFAAKGNIFVTGPEHLVFGRLAAIVGAALLLLAVRGIYKAVRHREGLGLGDVKLLAMIAAFLGFWPAMLALFVGVVLCSAYAVTLIARRKAHNLTRLPLGTFLAVGGMIAALFGAPLIAWYGSLL